MRVGVLAIVISVLCNFNAMADLCYQDILYDGEDGSGHSEVDISSGLQNHATRKATAEVLKRRDAISPFEKSLLLKTLSEGYTYNGKLLPEKISPGNREIVDWNNAINDNNAKDFHLYIKARGAVFDAINAHWDEFEPAQIKAAFLPIISHPIGWLRSRAVESLRMAGYASDVIDELSLVLDINKEPCYWVRASAAFALAYAFTYNDIAAITEKSVKQAVNALADAAFREPLSNNRKEAIAGLASISQKSFVARNIVYDRVRQGAHNSRHNAFALLSGIAIPLDDIILIREVDDLVKEVRRISGSSDSLTRLAPLEARLEKLRYTSVYWQAVGPFYVAVTTLLFVLWVMTLYTIPSIAIRLSRIIPPANIPIAWLATHLHLPFKEVPLRVVTGVDLVICTERVLNAWVLSNIDRAREMYSGLCSDDLQLYSEKMPTCKLNGRIIELKNDDVQEIVDSNRKMVITGNLNTARSVAAKLAIVASELPVSEAIIPVYLQAINNVAGSECAFFKERILGALREIDHDLDSNLCKWLVSRDKVMVILPEFGEMGQNGFDLTKISEGDFRPGVVVVVAPDRDRVKAFGFHHMRALE